MYVQARACEGPGSAGDLPPLQPRMDPSPQPLLLLYAAGTVESLNRALTELVSLFQSMCLSCAYAAIQLLYHLST